MNLPNKLSLLRIIMVPLFVVAYFLPYVWAIFVAVGIFIVACLTDFLDGFIARKYNLVTDLGKLLDPIADKMLVCSALFCVVVTNPLQNVFNIYQSLRPGGWFYGNVSEIAMIFTLVCAIIIMSRELFISGFRQVAANKGIVLQANIFGKIKTVLLNVCLPIVMLLNLRSAFYILNCSDRMMLFCDTLCHVLCPIGWVLLALATVMTIVSGIIYVVQNKKVLDN